ncbi:hypothetical protein GY45DRAFT_790924 [Cubamyces sp. BRFM 1775]|nr:hypothetical protein GY45DRAFT_790924 [Cubamyces sp. BRFM 1775]
MIWLHFLCAVPQAVATARYRGYVSIWTSSPHKSSSIGRTVPSLGVTRLIKMTAARSQVSVQRLNYDVFLHLAQELQTQSVLTNLSSTCKLYRQWSMPILYRVCRVHQTSETPTTKKFPPRSIWSYIGSITIHDILCPDSHRYTPVPGASNNPRCGIVNGAILEGLLGMPKLHAVHLIHDHHGIPWPVLQSILTLPQLREFSCNPRISHTPEGSARLQELVLNSPAPLTSFQYTRDIHAISHLFDPLQSRAEEHLLDLILRSVCSSLHTLVLPIESAPLRTMSSLDFPRLQRLMLGGLLELAHELQCDIVTALHKMPELRVLELDIALSPDHAPRPIWPPGPATTYPWPHLQRLCVSFPRTEDQMGGTMERSSICISAILCGRYLADTTAVQSVWPRRTRIRVSPR